MPKVAALKPVVKITEKQWKALLNRVLTKEGKGGINPNALHPGGAMQMAPPSYKFEGVTPPSPFQNFQQPQMEQILRPQGMQMELPGILPPQSPMSMQRVGQQVPPSRSDLMITGRPGVSAELPSAMDEVKAAATPVDRTYGRLYEQVNDSSVARDYPWPEARMRYLKEPDRYTPSNTDKIPEALRMRPIKDETGQVKDLAYERIKWRAIEDAESKGVDVNRLFVKEAANEAGVPITIEQADDMAWRINQYWKEVGGGRGQVGRKWETLRKSGEKYSKKPDSKSYFSWSVGQYKTNPENFQKRFPREHKELTGIWDKYMSGAKTGGKK